MKAHLDALPLLSGRDLRAPRPQIGWWSGWLAHIDAWRDRLRDAAAIRQLARHDPHVLDDIGAPAAWRAQVHAHRERSERWQLGMLNPGTIWPGR